MPYTWDMSEMNPTKQPAKKPSSVRHTRAIQRDRSKRPTVAPPEPVVADRLTEVIHPATLAQLEHFRTLGLRERVLTLPVMVALVLSMIWRQIGAGAELVRLLNTEGVPVVFSGRGLRASPLPTPAGVPGRAVLRGAE